MPSLRSEQSDRIQGIYQKEDEPLTGTVEIVEDDYITFRKAFSSVAGVGTIFDDTHTIIEVKQSDLHAVVRIWQNVRLIEVSEPQRSIGVNVNIYTLTFDFSETDVKETF